MNVTGTITDGSMLAALPLAVVAGLVSFLSPCILPLVPGYLSYVTGLTGVDLEERRRGRLVAGAVLFVAGFTFVFVTAGLFIGGMGTFFVANRLVLQRVLGAVTIVLGLAFLGLIPGMQRDLRFHLLPRAGLAGAPLLGVLFGVGWTPCLGPTLGAVQGLAFTQASAGRGAFLAFGYCLGLGVPFVLTALAMTKALNAFAVVKGHYQVVLRVGGGLLIVVGLLLVSGVWEH
ncbi:MAG: cytochrome c-type biosis protein, partial [Actinomycetota bacterium]|nr:cytochrome c-type biosis protein [Actinomycetota bacterium]